MRGAMMDLAKAIQNCLTFGETAYGRQVLHVGMAGTADYIPRLGITAMSLMKYNPSLSFAFHFFVSALSEEEARRLAVMSERMHCLVKVYIIRDDAFSDLVRGMYSASFWYRFIMPDIVGQETDRLLYLDGDMMCHGSIQKLKNLAFGGKLAAVVSDREEEKQKKQIGTARFFNSGMMLINTKKWISMGMLEKVIQYAVEVRRFVNKKGRYKGWHYARYNDQNILNKILDRQVIWLPKSYNYIYKLNRSAFFRRKERNEDYQKQRLLHFAGAVKPWHSWVQNWPVVREYRDIWLDSPWESVPLSFPSGRQSFHAAAREYKAEGQYVRAAYWYWIYLMSLV